MTTTPPPAIEFVPELQYAQEAARHNGFDLRFERDPRTGKIWTRADGESLTDAQWAILDAAHAEHMRIGLAMGRILLPGRP